MRWFAALHGRGDGFTLGQGREAEAASAGRSWRRRDRATRALSTGTTASPQALTETGVQQRLPHVPVHHNNYGQGGCGLVGEVSEQLIWLLHAVWQDRHSCRVGSSRAICLPRPCFSLPYPFISHPSCACMCVRACVRACMSAYMYMSDQPLLFQYRKTDSEFCDNHVCTGGSFTYCAVCLVRC